MYINIQIRVGTCVCRAGRNKYGKAPQNRNRKIAVAAVVSCYCFRAKGIVSVLCPIVLSKDCKPFMCNLTRAATNCPQGHVKILPYSSTVWKKTYFSLSRQYFQVTNKTSYTRQKGQKGKRLKLIERLKNNRKIF